MSPLGSTIATSRPKSKGIGHHASTIVAPARACDLGCDAAFRLTARNCNGVFGMWIVERRDGEFLRQLRPQTEDPDRHWRRRRAAADFGDVLRPGGLHAAF